MFCQIVQKKQEEKRMEEEQAAKAPYWKMLACCDDDDGYNSAIIPILSTEEPVDSLSMGSEHLDTIPATESDEVIKSSVEDLVPIPSEFEGIPDNMCDVHLDNNHTLLEAKDHVGIVINSNDGISSSDDDSLHEENIEYVEASPYDSELVRLKAAEIVIPKVEEIEDDNLREKLLNEFVDELAHIIPPPEYDCFYFWNLPDPGELMYVLNSGIRENLPSATSVNLPIEDDYSPLLAYVVWIFLAYLTVNRRMKIIAMSNSCYNSNSFGSDHCQPPQFTVDHPIFDAHNDFLKSQNELLTSQNKLMEQMTQLTSMCELACQIVQKKQEEKRIEEEQAANARYWKIPACCDDDDDYDFAITPVLSTEEIIDSLSMGEEHLNTIPATESDEVIKSSVEDLVPIPSEFEGIPATMCDVHLDNNHTLLEAKNHFETVINSNDDISSSDDDSLHEENIEYVEASPHDSEHVSLEAAEIVIPEVEEDLPDPGELMSVLNFGIRKNLSVTLVNLPIEDDHSLLLALKKTKKGQNQIKTGQKREGCQSREKFKAVAVERGRKTEENKKEWPKTHTRIKSYSTLKERRKEKGQKCNSSKVSTTGANCANCLNFCAQGRAM
nr:hypothetical protein [Tanacetum cinerariifolium]